MKMRLEKLTKGRVRATIKRNEKRAGSTTTTTRAATAAATTTTITKAKGMTLYIANCNANKGPLMGRGGGGQG